MPGYVYVLKSVSRRHYVGSTNNLQRRMAEHARGKTATTAKDAPWKLIGYSTFANPAQAHKQELIFKRWKNPSRVVDWLANHGVMLEQTRHQVCRAAKFTLAPMENDDSRYMPRWLDILAKRITGSVPVAIKEVRPLCMAPPATSRQANAEEKELKRSDMRDQFLDSTFQKTQIPIMRFKAERSYMPNQIRDAIEEIILVSKPNKRCPLPQG